MIVDAVYTPRNGLDDDREADARDERDEGPRIAPPQRRERDAIEYDADQTRNDDRDKNSGGERISGENDRETNERREHEDRGVRQIENIEDTEHQSIAYREERIGCSEEDSVCELLC